MLKWLPPQSLFPDLKQVVTYFDAKKEATKNLTRQVYKTLIVKEVKNIFAKKLYLFHEK